MKNLFEDTVGTEPLVYNRLATPIQRKESLDKHHIKRDFLKLRDLAGAGKFCPSAILLAQSLSHVFFISETYIQYV